MPNTGSPESTSPPASLRERLKQESEQTTVLLSPELLEKLSTLPQSVSDAGDRMIRGFDETAERSVKRLSEIAETARQSSQQAGTAATRLAELQQSMGEAERNLTYQVERLKRQADRAQWMQTSVILLALAAGILGGVAAALAILNWVG
jgi:hypothetical protein